MPRLVDMQAAVPKCPRITKRMGHEDRRCGRAMLYDPQGNVWSCPVVSCAMTVKGLLLAEAVLEEAA